MTDERSASGASIGAEGSAGGTSVGAAPDPRALPLRPPAHQVDPRAVRWWQLRAIPTIVVLLVVQVVGIMLFSGGWSVLLTVTAAVTLAAGVAYEIVVPRLLFRLHRWEVTDEAVYPLSGWLVREWRIAPISRVQTVDTEHGPLQQMLKLATVTVTTASARGPVKIAGLADGDARELARTLTETTQAHPGGRDVSEQATIAHPEIAWRRLPSKMIVVAPATLLVKFLPALIVVLIFGGSESPVRIWITMAIVVAAVSAGLVRWRTTRYRITPDRVELHSGLVQRKRLSVPRDRIRTVDLTSTFLHQVFRLSVVKVGTGQAATPGGGSGVNLDAVTAPEAERLRRELLAVTHARAAPDVEAPVATPARELDRLDWSSLRYAPLTVSSLAAIGALAAALYNFLRDANVDPRTLPGVSTATGELETAPLWASVLVGLGLLLVILVAGSLVLFTERWWNFRLTREPDGTLRVRRGLLTQRSLSVSERRLRGVAVAEPLLVRLIGRGAQASALSVGLRGSDSEQGGSGGALQPPVPRAHAHDVATAAMGTGDRVTDVPLDAHPRSALPRRLTRAVVPSLFLVAVAWWLDALWDVSWLGPVSIVLPVLAVPLALDRYRSLGHRLDARFLVSRQGSLLRATTALERDGVIGWRIRQSWFQRRAGVVTLDATTAAGQGAYTVLDVDPARAAELVAAVTPDAVAPFRL